MAIFSEVVNGYSPLGFGPGYFRHVSYTDSAQSDSTYQAAYQKALKSGIPKLVDREAFIFKEGFWTAAQDVRISDLKIFIQGLTKTKALMVRKADIDGMNKQIDDAQIELYTLEQSRKEFVGLCAENYANKKANEVHVLDCLFKDKKLEIPYFSPEERAELAASEFEELVRAHNELTSNFSDPILKRVAISPFFINSLTLSEDDVFNFYGKPVVQLTFYQIQLYSFGRNFRFIINETQGKIPDEIMENPDDLLDWYNSQKSANEILNKNKEKLGGASTIVGASKEDYARMGVDQGDILDLGKEMRKKGGSLSLEDLIKLH